MPDKTLTTKCECQTPHCGDSGYECEKCRAERASWRETTRLRRADDQVKIWSNMYSLCPSSSSLKVLIGYLEEYATAWIEAKCHD